MRHSRRRSVFLSAWAIWISAETPDRRTAVASVHAVLDGLDDRAVQPLGLPAALGHSPARVAGRRELVARQQQPDLGGLQLATGLHSWPQLVYQVGRMIGFQLVGAVLFTVAAIVRLRPAHRALAGVDRQARRRERRRLVWRFRPRPPVGDDPIFWREKYTSRENGLHEGRWAC